ncbi:hypothetical protein [Pseudoalteromonas peptidolytica]|uniref:Uncharacterized protein n=1 Tax=Pseudoalteromonas peptidolytica F12-50-A1 TaxID=1315280 RepID=A0A8I0N0Y4_9GAMM|nr:hypothetical protein [Pseudoalteromonas peptidolytica]MBE0349118.1 hypothetical protein [Pseudoalteromonas peptidolytica F12-50-A1]NLR17209.1 hypothetical protein [Pseudoalteromonas peptidolytica]GEK11365.1 hypothetical protein PPE03_36140 [Pseudoalteromonas peptidolytica]
MHYSLGFSLRILAGGWRFNQLILPFESKTDDPNQYVPNVTTLRDFEAVSLQWMGHSETLNVYMLSNKENSLFNFLFKSWTLT